MIYFSVSYCTSAISKHCEVLVLNLLILEEYNGNSAWFGFQFLIFKTL